jgi:hypothetical protein
MNAYLATRLTAIRQRLLVTLYLDLWPNARRATSFPARIVEARPW